MLQSAVNLHHAETKRRRDTEGSGDNGQNVNHFANGTVHAFSEQRIERMAYQSFMLLAEGEISESE